LFASDKVSYCATLLFANKKLTLLIAALSWILLTRGIVDDRKKCSAGVSADGGEEDDDSCKNKLQFVNTVLKLFE
jgi:hypothetical protein